MIGRLLVKWAERQKRLADIEERLYQIEIRLPYGGAYSYSVCMHQWGAPHTGGQTCMKCGQMKPPDFVLHTWGSS